MRPAAPRSRGRRRDARVQLVGDAIENLGIVAPLRLPEQAHHRIPGAAATIWAGMVSRVKQHRSGTVNADRTADMDRPLSKDTAGRRVASTTVPAPWARRPR